MTTPLLISRATRALAPRSDTTPARAGGNLQQCQPTAQSKHPCDLSEGSITGGPAVPIVTPCSELASQASQQADRHEDTSPSGPAAPDPSAVR